MRPVSAGGIAQRETWPLEELVLALEDALGEVVELLEESRGEVDCLVLGTA